MEPLSLFPLENFPQVSLDLFNLFHTIDRQLFTRLIQNLGRDPAQSMQVMAFWMWLEKQTKQSTLIKRILSLPPRLVNELADEAVSCLECAERDQYPFSDYDWNPNEITLLPDLLSSPVICLRFFHDNRVSVLQGVSKMINNVCARAFNDILHRASRRSLYPYGGTGNLFTGGRPPVGPSTHEVGESSRSAEERDATGGVRKGGWVEFMNSIINEVEEESSHPAEEGSGGGAVPPPPAVPLLYYPYMSVPFVPLPSAGGGGFTRRPPVAPPRQQQEGHRPPPPPPVAADAVGIPVQMVARGVPVYEHQMLSGEIGEMLSNMSIGGGGYSEESVNVLYRNEGTGAEEEEAVPVDDRTIFLTFSKGYPISEDEVREFFTWRFGNFIEELIMQEVAEDEQPLYARMVARSPAVIDIITGENKAKYSINGKHVWARKYVKKPPSSNSPPSGET